MSDHITLVHSFDKSDFARRLPMAGTVARAVRAKNGETWQLLRLKQPTALTAGTCGWLLVRECETELDADGVQISSFDVLRAAPQIVDGFDAAIFEHLGRARTHPPRDDAIQPSPKPSWDKIAVAAGGVAVAGWLLWHFSDNPNFPIKLVLRLIFGILSHLK